MRIRDLARHQNLAALQLHGVSAADLGFAHPMGFAPPAFPQNNDGGTGSTGGGGSTGSSGGSSGDDDTDDDDGEKPVSEMSDAEKAAFWRKQARANERKLKSAPRAEDVEKLKADAAELEKIRDSQRTDSERAVARAETAEKKLAELEPKLLRLEVAYEKGLPAKLAKRLTGSTRAELEADADDLLEEFGAVTDEQDETKRRKAKQDRSAARKDTAKDAGVRGDKSDTKASVASGADLFAQRRKKTTTAASAASA
jgi:hypothetical protein